MLPAPFGRHLVRKGAALTSQDTRRHAKPQEQQQQAVEEEKKSILSQLSMPAVVAASLTSVTSFLLSSKLGLTGSLIGAAIAAAVSTIASQLYNAMIRRSIEKVKGLSETVFASPEEQRATSKTNPNLYVPQAQGMNEGLSLAHAKQLAIRTFVVAAVAALIALLGYTAVVNVATQGQGIGPSIEEISAPISQPVSSETATPQDGTSTDVTGTDTTGAGATTNDTTTEQGQVSTQDSSENSSATSGTASDGTSSTGPTVDTETSSGNATTGDAGTAESSGSQTDTSSAAPLSEQGSSSAQ